MNDGGDQGGGAFHPGPTKGMESQFNTLSRSKHGEL